MGRSGRWGRRANCSSGYNPPASSCWLSWLQVGQVALTYHNDIEQLLAVVFPYLAIAAEQAGILATNTRGLPGPVSELQST